MSNRPSVGLRERKKAQTRHALQQHALRLFTEQGYDATTVEEIAAAANVSPMTFYRYFPTKEHVVLADDYDPMIAELIASRPADESIIESVRYAMKAGLEHVYAADRDTLLARTRLIADTPALRARLWEQQAATERLVTEALAGRPAHDADVFRIRVAVAACLAIVTSAIFIWVERPDAAELPELIDRAFAALPAEVC